MTVNSYDIGDMVEMQSNFTDKSGNPLDPTTITLRIKTPNGKVQVFTYALSQLTKISVGGYAYDFTTTMAGIHKYRFEGTGACVAAEETEFSVNKSDIISG